MPAFALALALALLAQDAPAADPAPAAATPAAAADAANPAPQDAYPAGAPHDDYQFVGWCYGALRGYLDLHDQVMPEVTRIESEFRRPGSKLSDDLKVYADAQKQGRADLKLFQEALTAAEKASVRPINVMGAAAVEKGRNLWNGGPDVTKARMAQEWMSWTLPAKCQTTARDLKKRAVLMGPAFKVNAEPEPLDASQTPAAQPTPAADANAAPADKPADPAAAPEAKPNR